MSQFESIVKHFQVLLQSQGSCWEFLLVVFDVLCQLPWRVYENKPFASFQTCQEPFMVFGVFSDPRVTVINKNCCDIFISKAWKNYKPFRKKVCFKAITGASVCEVHHDFIWLCIVWLQGQQHVVDQQIPVDLTSLEPVRQDRHGWVTFEAQSTKPWVPKNTKSTPSPVPEPDCPLSQSCKHSRATAGTPRWPLALPHAPATFSAQDEGAWLQRSFILKCPKPLSASNFVTDLEILITSIFVRGKKRYLSQES